MKVLIINGSSRKGNCKKITDKITESMKNIHSDLETETIFLSRFNLKMCVGCHSCYARGEKACPVGDERDLLEKKILESDGVIFISPVYSLFITSYLKNWFDRFSYRIHRPDFFHQKAMIISVSGGSGIKASLNYMWEVLSYMGFDLREKMGIVIPEQKMRPKRLNKIWKTIQRKSEGFARSLSNPIPAPTMSRIGFFYVWKSGAIPINKDNRPFDYNYWQEHGWLDKKRHYYTDQNIGLLRKLMVPFIKIFMKFYIEKFLWAADSNGKKFFDSE